MTEDSQINELTRSWAETQRRLWESWRLPIDKDAATTTPFGSNEMWRRAMDIWEQTVSMTLEAQAAGLQMWIDGLSGLPNLPEPTRAQLQQLHELARGWSETQRSLWQTWFNVTRQFSTPSNSSSPTPPQGGLEMWEQMLRPALDAQASWLRTWSSLLTRGQH
jgi:hypothetical protein